MESWNDVAQSLEAAGAGGEQGQPPSAIEQQHEQHAAAAVVHHIAQPPNLPACDDMVDIALKQALSGDSRAWGEQGVALSQSPP